MSDQKKPQDQNIVVLKGVRLSYESIYKPRTNKGDDGSSKESYSANFILRKDDPQVKIIKQAIRRVVSGMDKWKGKTVKVKGTNEVLQQGDSGTVVLSGICFRDGEDLDGKVGYGPDVMFISSSAKADRKPKVVNRKRVDVGPGTSESPYSGCYVNASVRLWPMDNDFGKRVCAELRAVMFDKDGEAFGAGPVDADKEFAGLGDEDDLSPSDDGDI